MKTDLCRICGSETIDRGQKYGAYGKRSYNIRHCPNCRFSFVANPWTEYEKIYSEDYYNGLGADPYVDYTFELANPGSSIRQYEWAGLLATIRSLTPINANVRWLDFGCGNGGLVRYVREKTDCPIVGFDEGWIRDRAVELGIPFLQKGDLETQSGVYDIVTAIEVLEHVVEPLEVLSLIRRLLKPGGLFFCTTGNAAPYREKILEWQYLNPDMHISFFEPGTLALALQKSGFRPEFRGYHTGAADIIRFKVLKNFHLRQTALAERLLPWGIMSRIVDWRLGVTAHPIGWAEDRPAS